MSGSVLEILAGSSLDLDALAARLDGLDPAGRLREVRSLGRRDQARLFEACKGGRPLALEHLVPEGRPPMVGVVHEGKNSLPFFSHFAKVFCRPDGEEADSGVVWGYNRSGAFLESVVGPGYFVARPWSDGELLVDYLREPPRKAAGWPAIIPNSARLSRVVYYRTQDILRGVSEHVVIGRATRDGRPMDAGFMLCRTGQP